MDLGPCVPCDHTLYYLILPASNIICACIRYQLHRAPLSSRRAYYIQSVAWLLCLGLRGHYTASTRAVALRARRPPRGPTYPGSQRSTSLEWSLYADIDGILNAELGAWPQLSLPDAPENPRLLAAHIDLRHGIQAGSEWIGAVGLLVTSRPYVSSGGTLEEKGSVAYTEGR